ncbi:MAG: T9SS type A sorting domain-containing protein [candidate division WOR-3 bacterium]
MERDSLIKIIEEGIGEGPIHLCLSEHNNKIYCVNWGGNVSVISSDLDSVINVISVAPCSHSMCYNLRDKKVYVGHLYNPVVEIICTEGDTIITTINVGSDIVPFGICYDSIHNKIYISTGANYVVVIDGETNNIIDVIYFYGWPWIVFFNPLNKKIYVSYENPWIPESSFVGIIDGSTGRKIDSISLYRRGAYYPFCLNPQENRVYIPHAWCDANGNPMDSVISIIKDNSEISESSTCFFEIKYFPNSFNPEYIILPFWIENIEIFEISGKLIKKERRGNIIFLKNLKSGVYFVRMSSFKKEYIKKLLIIK